MSYRLSWLQPTLALKIKDLRFPCLRADTCGAEPTGACAPLGNALRSALHITEREEATMFLSIVATVNSTVIGWARTIGQAVKRLLRPPSSIGTMACAVARGVTGSRSDLLAENASIMSSC